MLSRNREGSPSEVSNDSNRFLRLLAKGGEAGGYEGATTSLCAATMDDNGSAIADSSDDVFNKVYQCVEGGRHVSLGDGKPTCLNAQGRSPLQEMSYAGFIEFIAGSAAFEQAHETGGAVVVPQTRKILIHVPVQSVDRGAAWGQRQAQQARKAETPRW